MTKTMTDELKPVRCGCGGEAKVEPLPFETWNDIWDASVSQYLVRCDRCGMTTRLHDTEAEAIAVWNRAMGNVNECAKDARCNERTLNLDAIVSEQEEIMRRTYSTKEKDPDAYRQFVTARMVKVYLLKKFARQENNVFCGHWVTNENGEEVCGVCWMPRKASELDGHCIMCGAEMRGKHE